MVRGKRREMAKNQWDGDGAAGLPPRVISLCVAEVQAGMHSWIGGGVAGTGQVPGGENGLEGLDGGLSCLGARGCAWLRGPTRSR